MNKKLEKISRELCFILRHDMTTQNLKNDERGFVKLRDMYTMSELSNNEIQFIVESCSKKRFDLDIRDGEYFIRANQGHSNYVGLNIDANLIYESITAPLGFCAHGTRNEYMKSILENGLQRKNRKYIHFVSEISKDKQISGFKNESNIIIVIDMKKCLEAGIKFYKSSNGVILSDGIDGTIDPSFFEKIEHI